MGQFLSVSDEVTEKIPVDIKLKQHSNIELHVPYSKLEMIKLLQTQYDYEVKGALYFDHQHKFKSFDIRTDNEALYFTGASDWKIYFHTHPDKTSQTFGIRYYSPPSVDDVMEIYDHTRSYVPTSICSTIGELSIIFANEGIYVMQLNRESFKRLKLNELSDDDLEDKLNSEFNSFIVNRIKADIKGIYDLEKKGKPDYNNPDISYEQFTTILKSMAAKVDSKFGFKLEFYNWIELEKEGLTLKSNTYFVNKKVVD